MQAMIVPGNGNANLSLIWYPYVKQELEKLGINVIAKNMPDPDLARRKYWIPFMESQIKNNEDIILIGHSSGVVAILRYLENHKAKGAVLVSAYSTDLGDEKERLSGYFDEPWQWEKIKKNVNWITQFSSSDDSFIPIEEARHLKDKLSADYHEFSDHGHFIDAEYPEIISAIKEKLQ
tara:strand:- start:335 stop:868 length:534 start_codon:yes stop_codon:yes gene_type:complete